MWQESSMIRLWQNTINQYIVEFVRFLRRWRMGGMVKPDEGLGRVEFAIVALHDEGQSVVIILPSQKIHRDFEGKGLVLLCQS